MFDNSLINVAIGLAFLFLIYSLFVTALQEVVATLLKRRSSTLYRGIRGMLTNTPRVPVNKRTRLWLQGIRSFWWQIRFAWLSIPQFFSPTKERAAKMAGLKKRMRALPPEIKLYENIYRHPIIKNYRQNSWFNKPSYISPQTFSSLLVEEIKNLDELNRHKTATFQLVEETLMAHNNKIDREAVDILKYHLNEAAGDLDAFKMRLEKWFNDTMDRVSGWYKRNTQFILFLLAAGLAIVMNIDTIEIVKYLSRNKPAAEKLAEMGVAAAGNPRYSPADSMVISNVMDSLKADLHTTTTLLGLGWNDYGASDSLFMENRLRRNEYMQKEHAALRDSAEQLFRQNRAAIEGNTSIPAAKRAAQLTLFDQDRDSLVRQYQFSLLYKDDDHATGLQVSYVWYRLKNIEKLIGLFITAIAIGLGAPFWFDLLNKLVNMRTAGKVIPTTRTATAKNPGTNPEIDG